MLFFEKWHYMQVAGSEKKTNVKGFVLDISISGKNTLVKVGDYVEHRN